MSDEQLRSESPQDWNGSQPVSSDVDNADLGAENPPIGASTPGEWPQDDPIVEIALPDGGQFPEDIFGTDDADDAPVAMPESAFSGGLADVQYGNPGESLPPLPPPAEPQPLADISIDPLPMPTEPALGAVGEQPPATGGDMFSVDDLIDDPVDSAAEDAATPTAANDMAAATGGDMFSVDDFLDDETVTDDGAVADPSALDSAPPLESPAPLAMSDPLPTPEPLAMPEPVSDVQPLAMPEPEVSFEPLTAAEAESEPVADVQPLAMPEVEVDPQPLAMTTPDHEIQPLATPEPEPAFEPFSPPASEVVAEPFTAEESVSESVPDSDAPIDESVSPYGIIDAQAATPSSDFAFVDPIDPVDDQEPEVAAETISTPDPVVDPVPAFEPIAEVPTVEQQPEPAAETAPHELEPESVFETTSSDQGLEPAIETTPAEPQFEPLPAPEVASVEPAVEFSPAAQHFAPVEGSEHQLEATELELPTPEPELNEPAVVNPYATVSDEAEVIDPAAATGPGFDIPVAQDDEAPKIVNPYDVVSDEAEVIDPAMALSATASDQPEAEAEEAFSRTEPEHFLEASDGGEYMPPTEEELSGMPAAYGATSYETSSAPLPETSRTESVAPPGMEQFAIGGLVVAGAKRSSSAKRSRGMKRRNNKPSDGDSVVREPVSAQGPPEVQMPEVGGPIAADAPAPAATDSFVPDHPSTPAPGNPPAATEAAKSGKSRFGLGSKASKSPKAAKQPKAKKTKAAKAPKAAKAVKQPKAGGKSLADALLGKVEPGQRHKLFGISIGKPAPMPGQEAAAAPPAPEQAAPIAPVGQPTAAPVAPAAPAIPTADVAADGGAEVIESVEATAHALGTGKRFGKSKTQKAGKSKQPKTAKQPKAKKTKAAKAPKAAKAVKQPKAGGKSLADTLLGKVEPGQRHKLFGISIGKPAPMPGQEAAAAPPVPEQAAPIAPVGQPTAPPVAPAAPESDVSAASVTPEHGVLPAPSAPEQNASTAPQPSVPTVSQPEAPVAPPVAAELPAPSVAPTMPDTMVAQQPVTPMAQPVAPAPPVAQPVAPEPPTAQPVAPEPQVAEPVAPEPPVARPPVADSPLGVSVHAVAPGVQSFPGGYPADFSATGSPVASGSVSGGTSAAAAIATAAAPEPALPTVNPIAMQGPQGVVPVIPANATVFRLARWSQRAAAQIIDNVIQILIGFGIGFFAGAGGIVTTSATRMQIILLGILVFTIYQGGMTAYNNGQTIGKRMLNIRVVRENGEPLDLGFAIVRETLGKAILGLVPLYLLIDYLWPLQDDGSQALHDKLAKSRVVEA